MLQCEWIVDEALWVISGQDSLGKSCRALGFCCVVPLHKAWAFQGPDWWKSCLKYQTRAHSARIYTVLHFFFFFPLFHGFAPGIFTGNDFQQRRNGIVAYLGDTQLATQVHDNGTITVTAGYTDDNWVTTDVQKASVLVTYLCWVYLCADCI